MARRDAIVGYANELLEVQKWPEFAPPGLQVTGSADVTRLLCGVSASLDLLEQASARGAEMVLVHHGLYWRNEPLVIDRRLRGRIEALFRADASLVAYHLALDAHPELGNSAQLAARLGATNDCAFGGVGRGCTFATPVALDDLVGRVRTVTEREPVVFSHGPDPLQRIAISTGAAGYDLVQAAHEGYDALLTGEPEEPSAAAARELGVTLIAAGHHATERLGVQALAAHLADRFGLQWDFIDVPNPV